MTILALDPSLAATGYARTDGICGVLSPPAGVRGVARLAWVRDAVLELADGCDVVVIEGYSFASRGRAIVALGELGGVLRLALADAGVPVVEVPPSSRCKYATGKGNAKKEHVLVEAVRRLSYAGSSHDEADALWLLHMARDHYHLPCAVQVPKTNRAALEAIEWPATSTTMAT